MGMTCGPWACHGPWHVLCLAACPMSYGMSMSFSLLSEVLALASLVLTLVSLALALVALVLASVALVALGSCIGLNGRAGNEGCSAVRKRVFVFGVLFVLGFLTLNAQCSDMLGVRCWVGFCHVRCSDTASMFCCVVSGVVWSCLLLSGVPGAAVNATQANRVR